MTRPASPTHRRAPTEQANVAAQFLCYLVVGGAAFLVDLSIFITLMKFGFGVLVASTVGFVVGTLVNHVLSVHLAFLGGRFSRAHEVARLFAVALIGLALTTALIWVFLVLELTPVVAKCLAVVIVLAWNYLGRRLFVFHRRMPSLTQRWTDAALAFAMRDRKRRGG